MYHSMGGGGGVERDYSVILSQEAVDVEGGNGGTVKGEPFTLSYEP